MKVVLVGMFFLLGGVHPACFKQKEGKNSSWEWNKKIGSKKDNVGSTKDCKKLCFNDYTCVALTFKVRTFCSFDKISKYLLSGGPTIKLHEKM